VKNLKVVDHLMNLDTELRKLGFKLKKPTGSRDYLIYVLGDNRLEKTNTFVRLEIRNAKKVTFILSKTKRGRFDNHYETIGNKVIDPKNVSKFVPVLIEKIEEIV
jgi:hypothetical protein